MKFIVNIVLSSIYVNMDVNLFVCLALLLYGQKFVLIAICMVEWIDGCVDEWMNGQAAQGFSVIHPIIH